MRTWLCVTAFTLTTALASLSPRLPSPQDAAEQKSFINPCPNAATDAQKKACWTEVDRRAKFFLDTDPCDSKADQSDEERDNCKMERAKQATDRVDAYYQSLRKALRADLAKGKFALWNDSGLLTELRDTQSAWARYRDLQCEAETTPYDGGTVTISIKAGCRREKAEARLKELQVAYARYLQQK